MLQMPVPGPPDEGLQELVARVAPGEEDFAAFLRAHPRLFLHHFSGRAKFGLGEAVVEASESLGLVAEPISVDRDRGGEDLDAPSPCEDHLALARKGDVRAYHSGFPLRLL